MLRILAKWFISRSIDEERRLPDWLRRWIDRDQNLKQFETRSRELGDRLKNDASGWILSQALPSSPTSGESIGHRRIDTPQRVSPRRHRILALSLASGALAACCLLAISQLQSHKDQVERHSQEDPVVPSVSEKDRRFVQPTAVATITAADREWLIRSWNTSRTNLGQFQARAVGLPRQIEIWRLPGVSAVVEPAKLAGSTAGQAMATLDHGIESEQERLTSELKTAFSFFAYRLPSSIVKLFGSLTTIRTT